MRCETLPKPHLKSIDRQLQGEPRPMTLGDFASSDNKVARYKIQVALAAIKLQEIQGISAYPDANVAWHVPLSVLARADFGAIDSKILEGSLVRCTCGTEAIYVFLATRSSNSGIN